MNAAPAPSSFQAKDADRLGVVASVLCAIHCALAPVLLIFLPTFGKIWAHPASHALVAIFIVPLAAFSIWKGYRTHRKRWIFVSAVMGISAVLIGAALPAFSKGGAPAEGNLPEGGEVAEEAVVAGSCGESSCGAGCGEVAGAQEKVEVVGCVDQCCPSIQVSESGETSLHVPPAAIVTTLGGIFLIVAHVGNLRSGALSCFKGDCDCEKG